MADPNRLELVISLKDASSEGAQSLKRQIKDVVDTYKGQVSVLEKDLDKIAASTERSIQALERRAATMGKSDIERAYAIQSRLLNQLGDDKNPAAERIRKATNDIVAAIEERGQRIAAAQEKSERDSQIKLARGAIVETEAQSNAGINERIRQAQARQQSLQDLEYRASIAGLKPSQRIAMEANKEIEELEKSSPQAAAAAQKYYAKIIAEQKKAEEAAASGHGNFWRRATLATKDALEGYSRGTYIQIADFLVGQGNQEGAIAKWVPQIAEVTGVSSSAIYAVGGLAVAFAGLEIAGLRAMRSLGEAGQEMRNLSLKTGIAPENIQAFSFAAKAEGQDPSIYPRLVRGIEQAVNEDSTSGARARKEIKKLGFDLYDDNTGELKSTEDILTGLGTALKAVPNPLRRGLASMEIFKRVGPEGLPVLLNLPENLAASDRIGNTFNANEIKTFEEWDKRIKYLDEEWERFKLRVEQKLAIQGNLTIDVIANIGGIPGTLKNLILGPAVGLGSQFGDLGATLIGTGIEEGADYLTGRGPGSIDLAAARRTVQGQTGAVVEQTGQRLERQAEVAGLRERYRQLRLQVPANRIKEETDKQKELDEKAAHGNAADIKAAMDHYQKLQTLRDRGGANKGLEAVVAARQQGLQLDTQFAKGELSAAERGLETAFAGQHGLMPESDERKILDLSKKVAEAQTRQEIEERRKRIDTKTGREVDQTGQPDFERFKQIENTELLPKRIRDEYQKTLARFSQLDAEYYRKRTEEDMKAYEEGWHRRMNRELELQDIAIRTQNEIQSRRFDIDLSSTDRQKELALQGLGSVNAQTLKDKMSLEDRKFGIEKFYADKALGIQLARVRQQRAESIGELGKGADINSPAYLEAVAQTNRKYDQEEQALKDTAADREQLDALRTVKTKEDLQIQSNRKIYDSLKHDAEGLFDQLVFHTQSWGEFFKGVFKSAILTPIKEIFSSQVAGFFTGLLTGDKVTFDPVGTGQGKLGKLGDVFGRAGLGQPKFHIPKADLPGHIGDIVTIGGAMPVVVMNMPTGATQVVGRTTAGPSSTVFGNYILQGMRALPQIGRAAPTFGSESSWSPVFGDNGNVLEAPGTSPNGFPTLGEIAALGTPSGLFSSATSNPWDIPTPPPFDNGLSGVQLADWANPDLGPAAPLGSAQSGGWLSRMGGFLGLGNPGSVQGTLPGVSNPSVLPNVLLGGSGTSRFGGGGLSGGLANIGMTGLMSKGGLMAFLGQNVSGTDIGGGVGIANTGALGHLAAFGKSGAAAMIGGMLVLDSLSRKPGKATAVETPLGAGMIGFKLGGTGGALIGAGIGLGVDGLRRGGIGGALETAGGGALIGLQVGGPIGAVVGAAVGLGVGLFRNMFETDRQHAQKLVKQIYGMDINNATADMIVQLAKQSFGGQIDIAVRSPQVRDLLKLYSQATGQKKAEDMFTQETIHGASMVEINGRLMQQAQYDNGNPYAYASPFATYGGIGGIQTAPLSTYAPNNGVFSGNVQILINGQGANSALAGQVTKVATPGFVQNQVLAASNSSIGRTTQTRMTLQPSAIAG